MFNTKSVLANNQEVISRTAGILPISNKFIITIILKTKMTSCCKTILNQMEEVPQKNWSMWKKKVDETKEMNPSRRTCPRVGGKRTVKKNTT